MPKWITKIGFTWYWQLHFGKFQKFWEPAMVPYDLTHDSWLNHVRPADPRVLKSWTQRSPRIYMFQWAEICQITEWSPQPKKLFFLLLFCFVLFCFVVEVAIKKHVSKNWLLTGFYRTKTVVSVFYSLKWFLTLTSDGLNVTFTHHPCFVYFFGWKSSLRPWRWWGWVPLPLKVLDGKFAIAEGGTWPWPPSLFGVGGCHHLCHPRLESVTGHMWENDSQRPTKELTFAKPVELSQQNDGDWGMEC